MRLLKRMKSSWQFFPLFGRSRSIPKQNTKKSNIRSEKIQRERVKTRTSLSASRVTKAGLSACLLSAVIAPWSVANAANFSYSNTNAIAIPDNSPSAGLCGSTITRTINVADNFSISDVEVGVVLSHTYKSDLNVTITSPAGTTVVLYSGVGGSRDNLNILFDDEAATSPGSINHNVSSSFPEYTRQPSSGSLSAFDGENSSGVWTLSVCDTYPADSGTLTRFQLELEDGVFTPPPTFECTADSDAYMFQIPNPAASLLSEINTLNLVTGEFIGSGQTLSAHINGQGYNIKDDFIWGYNISLDNGSISRIAADGTVANYTIPGLPAGRFLVGDVDSNGHLYLTSYGLFNYYVVDVDPASPNYLTLINTVNVPSVEVGDWAFNPIDGKLYSITLFDSHSLIRIDPATGAQENLGLTGIPFDGVIGATYFDSNGFLYGYYNTDGMIYRIDISDPNNINSQAVEFSQGTFVEFNDGARCAQAPINVDYGDAPDTYGTTFANNGARHAFKSTSNVYLGTTQPDSDVDGQTTANATGDNNNGTNDEDAFTLLPNLATSDTSYSLTVACSGSATVAAWVDFDQSGLFESDERDSASCSGGSASLSWSGLSGLSSGQTYARFRIASTASEINNPTGAASDGEVEDYTLTINGPTPPVSSCGPVITSIMPSGALSNAGNASTTSVIAFDYALRGLASNTPNPIEVASAREVGTVWGKAYNPDSKQLYVSSFLRRHADISPDGLGAIYEVDVSDTSSDAAVGNPALWMDLNSTTHLGAGATLFGNETASNRGLGSPFSPSHDVWAYNRVGREGIGGLDISDDNSTLYAVDLTNRQLLVIDIASQAVTDRHSIGDPGCASANDIRPFGVNYLDGDVYVGVSCSNETNKVNNGAATAHVMRLSGGSFSSVVTGSLKGYRWSHYWEDDPTNGGCSASDKNQYVPLVTNMELDQNGNMLIGVTGVNAWRYASRNYAPINSCSSLLGDSSVRGFVIHATPNGASWEVAASEESSDDNYAHHYKDGQYVHWGSGNSHTYMSGMALTNCNGEEVAIVNLMDPLNFESAGTRYMRTSDAQHETASSIGDIAYATSEASTLEHYHGVGDTWEKSAGLGDIEYLRVSTTGHISGTVFTDANENNLFDSGTETGIGSITVTLQNNANSSVVATTVTAADGRYSFASLDPVLAYRVVVDSADTDLAGKTIGTTNPLSSVAVTAGNTTADQDFGFDSNVSTGIPVCWAIDDDTANIYRFLPDTSNPQPPVLIATSRTNSGEGLTWRPSANELFMWDGTTTYVLNPDTGADIRSFTVDLSPGTHVEGSAFYIDPVSKQEELWVIAQEYVGGNRDDRYLVQLNPDTGAQILSVGPLTGSYLNPSLDYGQDTGGLAIDPNTKQFWITNDGLSRGIYPLNEQTGVVGAGVAFNPSEVDAEALEYADDGLFYTESDQGPSNDRYIWQVDGNTGSIVRAAGPFPGSGDVEGVACNSGASAIDDGRISGTVYVDSNSNDNYDFASESGIAAITVNLLNDTDSSNIGTTTTAANGSYSFTGLDPALTYRIVVDSADTDLAGKTIGTTNPLSAVTVTAGNTTIDQNFGFDDAVIVLPPQAFVCDANIYIASAASDAVPSQLSSIDTATSPFALINIGDTSHGHNFNAMGYRDQDNFIYGIKLGTSDLVRIGSNGIVQDLGAVSGLPVPANIFQVYDSGDVFPDGFLYIHEVTSHPEIYKIDVTTTPPQLVQTINLSQSIWLSDFAYNTFDNKVYGMGDQGEKYMIDPATWAVSTVGANAPAASYGAVYTDNTGNVYTYKNNPGTFYRVDFGLNGTGTGDLIELSTAPDVAFNDGASCRAAPPVESCSLVVTTTDDSDNAGNNSGSLRDAIECANSKAGLDTISFNIPNTESGYNNPDSTIGNADDYWSIQPNSILPSITDPVIIAAHTQPGFIDKPIVEIDGTNAGSSEGFNLSTNSDGSTIRGLAVNRFQLSAIELRDSSNHTIIGNYIGTDNTGLIKQSNGDHGVEIADNSGNNTIGGSTALDRNIISGNNDSGIRIDGTGSNIIKGNYIGLGSDGSTEIGNDNYGIYSRVTNNQIGGTDAGDGNVISANIYNGIYAFNSPATIIQGNYVGTDATGTQAKGNQAEGILVLESSGVQIGGTSITARNVISGNVQSGIFLSDNAHNAVVENNYIGTDPTGTVAVANAEGITIRNSQSVRIGGLLSNTANLISGNSAQGIWLRDAVSTQTLIQGNTIGLDSSGASLGNGSHGIEILQAVNTTVQSNTIAHNTGIGVAVRFDEAVDNSILSNSIYSNGGLGIDHNADGVTANDASDSDIGANELLNHPVINSSNNTSEVVDFDVDLPVGDYRVEFFSNPAGGDPSGNGEGQDYINAITISHTGAGSQNYSEIVTGLTTATNISATVTEDLGAGDYGSTSEFSEISTPTAGSGSIQGAIFEDPNYGGGSGRPRTTAGTITTLAGSVELYNAVGSYVASATTSNGGYSFSNLADGKYYVRVVGTSVSSARPGSNGAVIGVQTFRTDGTTDVINEVGGRNPAIADASTNDGSSQLNTSNYIFTAGTLAGQQAQTVQPVTITQTGVIGVDFGFNFSTIVNKNDAGQGSLRQFVINSNLLDGTALQQALPASIAGSYSTVGHNVSIFMIPASDVTAGDAIIPIGDGIDVRAEKTVLDGRTQILNVGTGRVIIDSLDSVINRDGLTFEATADFSVLRYVTVQNIGGNGVVSGGTSTDKMEGLIIEQNTIRGNGYAASLKDGIRTYYTDNSLIQGNIITENNGYGIVLFTDHEDNTIANNTITLNETGGLSLERRVNNTTINNNTLFSNNGYGVYIREDSENNTLRQNIISENGVSNGSYGLQIVDSSNNTYDENTIAANGGIGLHLAGTTANSLVENNTIQQNGGDGIFLQNNAADNTIRLNTIENNNGDGIRNEAGSGNAFSQNSITSNNGLGIDLGVDGVTANDANDTDTGSNDLLNYPVITSAVTTTETMNFDLDVPTGNYIVEFFNNPTDVDPSGHGEGQIHIGSVAITHPGGGNQSFSETLAGLNAASLVSATITEDLGSGNLGSTSEFSGNIETLLEADLSLTKRLATGQNHTVNSGESVTFTLTVTNESSIDVSNIQLVDYMPGALTLDDVNWTANGSKVTMNSPIATLAAGDSVSVDIRFIANNTIIERGTQARVGGVIVNEEVECRNGAEIQSFDGGVDKDSIPDDTEGNDSYEDDYSSETFNVNGLCASPFDYGDAPDTDEGEGPGNYITLEYGDGPRHQVTDLLYMGSCADTDNGNSQSMGADADDISASYFVTVGTCATPNDDEDGLTPPVLDDMQVAPTVDVSVNNQTGHDVTLSCWVDYNADGIFDNATERGQATGITSQAGSQNVTVTLPDVPDTAGNDTGGSSYLRCRLASGTDADNPTGAAADGEVEDYVILISPRCTLSAEVNNISCSSDNNTIDPSDDLWDFDVRVTGTGISGSPTWQVTGDVTGSNYIYNQFENFVVGSIQDNQSIDVTFEDEQDNVCHVDSQIDAPASCSPSCDISIAASNVVRNCQGSASITDDTVSVDVTVAGPHSTWDLFREATTGDVNVGSYSGARTVTHTFNVSDILLNNNSGFSLSARETDYGDCANNVFVNLPACPSMPRLSVADNTIVEGNNGTRDLSFTVALGNSLQRSLPTSREEGQCTESKTVTETFDSSDIFSEWEIQKYSWDSCNWYIDKGLLKEESGRCRSLIVHPLDSTKYNTESTNYDITANVDSHNHGNHIQNNGLGITFGYTSKYNFYYVRWLDFGDYYEGRSGYKFRHLQIIKYVNGAPNILIEQQMDLPRVFDLKVSVNNEGIKVFVDDDEKLSVASEQPPLKQFGVSSRDNDNGVYYDSLVVNSHCDEASENQCQDGNGNDQFDNPFCVANDSEQVTVGYAVVDGSASIDNNDFEPVTVGQAIVEAGESTVQVTVPIIGDTDVEPDETFSIVLSDILNAEPVDNLAVGTIVNDDFPTASIDDGSTLEGDSGAKELTFNVTLNAPAPVGGISFDYATTDATATTANNDYQSETGTVTIPEGETTGTISITIVGDTDVETDETFRVNLTNPVNINLNVSEVTGTIVNDDAIAPIIPAISVADMTVNEGDSGTTPLVFTLTQSQVTTVGTTVNYTINEGTATLADNDYQAGIQGLTGTVTIPAGSTQATVTLDVVGDTNVETNENLTITLTNPVNTTISDSVAVGTIVDNDVAPAIPAVRVSDMSVYEGDSGTTPLIFTLTQSEVSATDTAVSYAITDNTATLANSDYQAGAQGLIGTVTIPAGSTQVTITVDVMGDTNIETDEDLTITLSNPVNVTISDDVGIGTIVDDDGTAIPNCAQIIAVDQATIFPVNQASCVTIPRNIPTVNASISNASTVEGNSGTKTLDFTVTLDAAPEQDISIDYSTVNDTATTGDNDYQSATGTLTIPAGNTTGTISVTIVGDTDVEADETFQLNLSNPSGVNLGTTQVTGTIVNDDSPVTSVNALISNASTVEGNSGTKILSFTVTLDAVAPTGGVSIDYDTANGTASTGNNDYQAATGTLTIPAGSTTGTISVAIVGDTDVESDETFQLNLSNPVNVTLGTTQVTGTIINDDSDVSVCTASVNLLESDSKKKNGDGSSKVPDIKDLNIPQGNNRAILVIAAFEREHCNDSDCHQDNNSPELGSNFAFPNIQNGDYQLTARFEGDGGTVDRKNPLVLPDGDLRFFTQYGYVLPATNKYNNAFFSREAAFISLYESDIQTLLNGNDSGKIDISLPDTKTPLDNADDAVLMAFVFENVEQSATGMVRSGIRSDVNYLSTSNGFAAGNYTLNLSSFDSNQAPNEPTDGLLVFALNGMGQGSVSGDGFTDIPGFMNVEKEKTDDSNGDYTQWNEGDGIAARAYFKQGITNASEVSVQSTASSSTQSNGGALAAFTLKGCPNGGVPQASVSNSSIQEGDSGMSDLNFTVLLDNPAPAGGVLIDYHTANGSATTGNNDYQSASGTLTIAEGETAGIISVSVIGDTDIEMDETFQLNLSNPSNADLIVSDAIGTIVNDDAATGSVNLQASKVANKSVVSSGDTVVFTLTVMNAGDNAATNISTSDVLPSGMTYVSDTSGGSYNPSTGEWVIGALPAGQSTSIDITVTIN